MVINTAADKEFFVKLLSLIGSIKKKDKPNRKIRVWNIGLEDEQITLLNNISNVEVKMIPPFMHNWQACYAWKIYIYKHIEEEIVFYMDTGMSVINDLDSVNNIIEKNNYFAIHQGTLLKQSTPEAFWTELKIDKKQFENSEQFAAGLFGFKRTDENNKMINEAYKYTLKGYTMGYSQSEIEWRDKYNVGLLRECKIFRQDQTLLNLIFRKHLGNPIFSNFTLFGSPDYLNDKKQIIWLHRKLFKSNIFYLFFSRDTNILYRYYFTKMLFIKIAQKIKKSINKSV